MSKENRVVKTYRVPIQTSEELKTITSSIGISETEAIVRAVHMLFLSLQNQEDTIKTGGIVPFTEYEKAKRQIEQLVYELGKAQGIIQEKDQTISYLQVKEQELSNKINELIKANSSQKKWWQFWRHV